MQVDDREEDERVEREGEFTAAAAAAEEAEEEEDDDDEEVRVAWL